MTTVFNVTNVVVPAAPPTFFAPSSAGVAVPAGATGWSLFVDSTGYSAGSSASMTVQYQYSGVWVNDVGVSGFTMGSYTNGKGVVTSVNSLNSSIGSFDNTGHRIGPYPDRVRLQIDQITAGTIASITVNVQ